MFAFAVVLLLGLAFSAGCAGGAPTAHKPLITEAGASVVKETPVQPETRLSDDGVLSADAFVARTIEAGGSVTFVFGEDRPFAQCHASTIAQAPDGTLIAAWFAGTEEKNPDVGIWHSRCIEGVWSPPTLAAKVDDTAHWNPVLFTDAEGAVHLFFKVGPEIPHWVTWWMTSIDGGATWTAPRELVPGDSGGRGPVKNKPIILSDGSWLAPASTELRRWEAFADRTTDRGRVWTRSADFEIDRAVFRGTGAIQPTFWGSAPGQVHALLRTANGRTWRSDSADYGDTWTPVYDAGLPNNNSGLDALLLEDGRLLLVFNPVGMNWGPRTPLSLGVSLDNGVSWTLIAHLEDDPATTRHEYSYPAIVRTRDGVAISYTYRREQVRCWVVPKAAL